MTFLGAGPSVRRPWRAELAALAAPDAPPVLEIIAPHFCADLDAIAPLADRYPLVVHDIGVSVGTVGPDALGRTRLARVRALVQACRPVLFTEHLAWTRTSSGVDLGHLCPIWLDERTFGDVRDRVRALQDVLGVPIALENPSSSLVLPHGDLDEPTFLARLCEETGCGVLLDVTNILVDARNAEDDPLARLRRYPLDRVVAVHLAGATEGEHWVDTHAGPVAPESFALLAALRGRSPLIAIIVERDQGIGPLSEVLSEARHADAMWRGTC